MTTYKGPISVIERLIINTWTPVDYARTRLQGGNYGAEDGRVLIAIMKRKEQAYRLLVTIAEHGANDAELMRWASSLCGQYQFYALATRGLIDRDTHDRVMGAYFKARKRGVEFDTVLPGENTIK